METDEGKIDNNTSIAVKKDADFDNFMKFGFPGTMSLKTAVKLAIIKGYRLISLFRGGWNAVFIPNEIGNNIFPEIYIEDAYRNNAIFYSLMVRNEFWKYDILSKKFPDLLIEV